MNNGKSIARRQRRERRRMMNRNMHHLTPRARHGGNSPDNLVEVDRKLHSAWHRVFHVSTPREAWIIASEDPYGTAGRIVYALVAEFGTGILHQFSKAA